MDNKTTETLKKTFDLVNKFAEDNGLFCECRVQSAVQQNSFRIYSSEDGNPIDSSIISWNIDIKDKLTFSGLRPHAKLWSAFMFESWDGGTYNVNSPSGEKKFMKFLDKSLEGYKNRQALKATAKKKSSLSR